MYYSISSLFWWINVLQHHQFIHQKCNVTIPKNSVNIILTTVTPWFHIPTFCIFLHFTHFLYCHSQMPIKTMFHFLRPYIPQFKFSWNLCFIFLAQLQNVSNFMFHIFLPRIFVCVQQGTASDVSTTSRPTKRWSS